MKKFYIFALFLLTGSVFAQYAPIKLNTAPYSLIKANLYEDQKNIQLPPKRSTGTPIATKSAPKIPYWVNFADAVDSANSGIGGLNSPPIFPDSTVVLTTGTGDADFTWWIHAAGSVFDPSSSYYGSFTGDEAYFNVNHSFVLDSVVVYFFYSRPVMDSTSFDTLRFFFIPNGEMDLANGGYFFPNTPLDTVRMIGMVPWTYNANTLKRQPSTTNMLTFDVLLGDNDVDSVFQTRVFYVGGITLPPDPDRTGANVVGIAAQYYPGHAYSIGDTLIEQSNTITLANPMNSVQMLFYEELSGSYPISPADAISFNQGNMLALSQWYDNTRDRYYSSFGYGEGWIYEHMYVDWLVTPIGADFIYTIQGLSVTVTDNSNSNFDPDSWAWIYTDSGGVDLGPFTGMSTTQSFSIPGTYQICLTAFNSVTSEQFVQCKMVTVDYGVGIDEDQPTVSMNIYPNPVHNRIHMELSSENPQDLDITIVDMVGQVVLEENLIGITKYHTSYDISNFANGIYFINVREENTVYTKKLVITK